MVTITLTAPDLHFLISAGVHAAVGLVKLIGAIGVVDLVLLTQIGRVADLGQLV